MDYLAKVCLNVISGIDHIGRICLLLLAPSRGSLKIGRFLPFFMKYIAKSGICRPIFFFIMRKVIIISTMSIILMAVSCKSNVTQELKEAYAKIDEIEAEVDSVTKELGIVSAKIDELEAEIAIRQEQPNNEEKELEENYIMIPGITYVSTQSEKDTDIVGGEVNLTMEFTIYKDGSVVGNLIETNSSKSYSNGNSYDHYVEGKWREVSKHDKRFLEICLVLEDNAQNYYKEFTYYVDENLKLYDNPSSSYSMQLKKK